MPRDDERIGRLARRQHGAVSRQQVLASGASASWLRSRVRTNQWQRAWPGTYVTFTGPVPWTTRAHAALLYAGPDSVLGPAASAYLAGVLPRPPAPIDVLVPRRTVRQQPGLRVRRGLRPEDVQPSVPRRLRRAPAVVLLSQATAGVDDVVALLCAAVRAGCHVADLREVVETRARVRHRRLLLDVLEDVAAGVESALERRYHRDVERRHRLPAAQLQVRQRLAGGWIRADRRHARWRLRIELDGRLAHPGGRTDSDCWRDNEVALTDGDLTLRYRWSHVAGTPCRTAAQVARALRARGWSGDPVPCGPACELGPDRGGPRTTTAQFRSL
ncbi:type IV toxin-antitoxin system AbiEi family antitoxin domain-containing protein [Thalassiella azotivora]